MTKFKRIIGILILVLFIPLLIGFISDMGWNSFKIGFIAGLVVNVIFASSIYSMYLLFKLISFSFKLK